MNEGKCETKRSEVTRAIDELTIALDNLTEAIGNLGSQLRPALAERPVPQDCTQKTEAPADPKLWGKIDTQTQRVQRLTTDVRRYSDELEI